MSKPDNTDLRRREALRGAMATGVAMTLGLPAIAGAPTEQKAMTAAPTDDKAMAAVPSKDKAMAAALSKDKAMALTCFIRYQIDPFQRDAFKVYAQNWGRIIPRCGGHLVGYFLPSEGTNDIAWGLIAFDSLAAYEAYRARLRADPQARENFTTAQSKRLILREERTFLETVAGTFERPASA